MVEKVMPFEKAINLIFDQALETISYKSFNFLFRAIYALTGVSISFSAFERQVDQNFATVRAFIRSYVRKRSSGKTQSSVAKNSDLLSLFFQSPDIFDEDAIIDELLDFFIAAT